jgi:hypothetical protein
MIDGYYYECMKYGFLENQVEEMTPFELRNLIRAQQEILAYKMWKQAHLNYLSYGCTQSNKVKFPKNPKSACPELF